MPSTPIKEPEWGTFRVIPEGVKRLSVTILPNEEIEETIVVPVVGVGILVTGRYRHGGRVWFSNRKRMPDLLSLKLALEGLEGGKDAEDRE